MAAEDRESLERRIGAALATRDWNTVTSLVLRGFGPEVAAFLGSLHRDGSADEVFSLFAEAVWRAAPSFEGRSSARTWAYAIARRASSQYRRATRRRVTRFQPFPEIPELAELEERIRTATKTFLRTETRSQLVALREQLPTEDQVLLMLRVDRKLGWDDLALVLHDEEEEPLSGTALKREAARLRKRFQLVKDKLRAWAKDAGLLSEGQGQGQGEGE